MKLTEVTFANIADLYDGPHATPPPADDGPVFLGIKNIREDGHLDLSEIRHIAEVDFPKWIRRVEPQLGDIVFTYEATLGRYALIPEGFRGCLGRRLALVRPYTHLVDYRYLYYYFRSPLWEAQVRAHILTGATVDRIPLSKVPDFKLRIHAIDQQKRIAEIISAYDDLIDNNNRRIALLEEAIHCLYREWFVHLRFPGYEHTPVVACVPQGWEKRQLQDVLILQRGFDLPTRKREPGEIPIYASTGVTGYHNKAKVKGPGIVTGRSGTLGKVMYVYNDFWPLNTSLWVKEFKNIPPEFAYLLLEELQLDKFNSGGAVPTLNRNHVHTHPIIKPPNSLLKRFEEIINPFFAQMKVLDDQSRVLAEARDALLPRLMNGSLAL